MLRSDSSPLRQLADIISRSVDAIDTSFKENHLAYPDLDAPFDSASPSEIASTAPDIVQAGLLIVAACAQLISTVKIPAHSVYDVAGGFHVSSALRVALESNIVEILRENPQGLHAKDIAAQNGMDPTKISRVLRLLVTHHMFSEIAPDTFKNNRLSSMMDSTKSVEEIKARPEDKHVGTPGFGALMEHTADEVFKGSAYMTELLLDPSRGHSEAPEDNPMSPSWEWYEQPGNEGRFKRLASAMEGSAKTDAPDSILKGFEWADLAPRSLVVDVGGGLGHTTATLYQQHPGLTYIVQDRAAVIQQAKDHWNRTSPAALVDGTVKLEAHDFFTPQPVKSASVFLLRMIIHDYGRPKATEILTHLRAAATADTKLLLVEQVMAYACPVEGSQAIKGIVGNEHFIAPKPLLPNLGKANSFGYLVDFQMYVGLNGEERTLGSFVELLEGAGWRITQIYTIPGSPRKQILAVPI